MNATVAPRFDTVRDEAADTRREGAAPRGDQDPAPAGEEGPLEDEDVKDERRLRPSPPTD